MMSRKGFLLILLSVVLLVCGPRSFSQTVAGKIYWTDAGTDKIQCANLDGSNVQDLGTSPHRLGDPHGIALDVATGKIYWTDAGTDKIQCANLDGSNVQDLIYIKDVRSPTSIALDVAADKMYWIQTFMFSSEIWRANLNGSRRQRILRTSLDSINGIALDAADGKMYWTQTGFLASSKIRCANLNGSNVQTIVTGLGNPSGIALDVDDDKMYWTDSHRHKIQRANLDGSNVQNLVTSGLDAPSDIALDAADGKMYWVEQHGDRIRRANLNGSNVQTLVSGLSRPLGIALGISAAEELVQMDDGYEQARSTGVKRMAIFTFEDKTGKAHNYGGLVDQITDDIIANVGSDEEAAEFLDIISRDQVEAVMAEQNLGFSERFDNKTVAGIGQVAGVHELVIGQITRLTYTAPRTKSTAIPRKRTLKIPTGKYVDEKGRTRTRYTDKRISATFTHYTIESSVTITASYKIIDVKTAAVKESERFTIEHPFSAEWGGYRGDEDALTRGDRHLISLGEQEAPLEENLVFEAGEKLSAELSEQLIKYVRSWSEPERIAEDVNRDGVVNIVDLTLVASNFGETGSNVADVNGDGVVNIVDLTLVAAAFGNTAAAPFVWSRQLDGTLTKAEVEAWLREARQINLTDPDFQRGIAVLEQLLKSLAPKETALLPNYPNPFNPETWIPYQLATPADVSISIYAADGKLVRTLTLGHQLVGIYESRSRAAYWDGRNTLGEPVASGVYFYTLTAGKFTSTRKMLIRK